MTILDFLDIFAEIARIYSQRIDFHYKVIVARDAGSVFLLFCCVRSEIHAVMTGGMATIAGSVLAAYIR